MSRYHSYPHDDDDWWVILIELALVVFLIFALWACQKGDREKCEARGGVWLSRESACVAPPPSR